MKLLYSPTSPYARKVRVVLREKTLLSGISEVVSIPSDKPRELLEANPLGKVPALILDDDSVLFDSPVICEYLDRLVPEPELIPEGPSRWPVLRAQALADGVLDVAVAAVMELRRPQAAQSTSALEHWYEQMGSAVARMHEQQVRLDGVLNLGHIAIAVALGYLDFRHPDFQWRDLADRSLIDWYTEFAGRQSMRETAAPV